MQLNRIIEHLCAGKDLGTRETGQLFGRLMEGSYDTTQIAALLVAFKAKGETSEEIAGAAGAMRRAATPFERPAGIFADTCGTGGDGAHTVNISTAVAFVAAACGLPITKHGNRSVSSRCGSADVLEACGVNLTTSPALARTCLDLARVCFLFAPRYHSGVKHAMPARHALGTRTMFNLLGPLVNPAAPPVQVMGVYDPELCVPLAHTLGMLGCTDAMVVHGAGLDEVAIHGTTTAALFRDGQVSRLTIVPEEAGLERFPIESLRGGAPEENASWLQRLLAGDGARAHVSAVALNAGVLLYTARLADTIAEGTGMAVAALNEGTPAEHLARLVEVSNAG